jgi:hypothetical protein
MAGILDNKSRILDFILTDIGKEQLRNGRLKFEFATFSDQNAFYEEGENDTLKEKEDFFNLESFKRYQDQIIPKSFENGIIRNFKLSDLSIFNSNVLSGSSIINNPAELKVSLNKFSQNISNNFKDNMILSEFEDLFEKKFEVSPLQTTIENNFNIVGENNVDIPNIPLDYRFSNLINYIYLPPLELLPDEDNNQEYSDLLRKYIAPDKRPFGDLYENDNIRLKITLRNSQIAKNLYGSKKINLNIDDQNNVILQSFLVNDNNEITKYTSVKIASMLNDNEKKDYYLFGKVFKNEDDSYSFIDAFILIIEKN